MKTKLLLFHLSILSGPALAQYYDQHLLLTQSIGSGARNRHQAISTIVAQNSVEQASSAQFIAGKSVTLQPGFVAQAGSVFEASIALSNRPGFVGQESVSALRAYPNPFGESTTVEYTVSVGGQVQHRLVDARGQVVIQESGPSQEQPGRHQRQLDGRGLLPGVYLYQVEVGGQTQTLRLLKP